MALVLHRPVGEDPIRQKRNLTNESMLRMDVLLSIYPSYD